MTNALPEKGKPWNHTDTATRATVSKSFRHKDLGVVLESLCIGVLKKKRYLREANGQRKPGFSS